MTDFYWNCHRAAESILSAMALGIGLSDEEYFRPLHPGHNNQLRLLHYPPIPAAVLEEQSASKMDAHSDWGSITMLFQDDCGGFQIEDPHKSGNFIDASPLKDAIVMNVGDLMMRWSNGTHPIILLDSLLILTNDHRHPQVNITPSNAASEAGSHHRRPSHDESALFHPVLCQPGRAVCSRMSTLLC